MVQRSPASIRNSQPSISAQHPACLSPPLSSVLGKSFAKGLLRPQCFYGGSQGALWGKRWSVGIIRTGQLWGFMYQTYQVSRWGQERILLQPFQWWEEQNESTRSLQWPVILLVLGKGPWIRIQKTWLPLMSWLALGKSFISGLSLLSQIICPFHLQHSLFLSKSVLCF